MRFVFLLLFLAGAGLGIAYPWAASNVAGYEIGNWRVYERDTGFSPVEANIALTETPVFVTVEIIASAPISWVGVDALFRLSAQGGGESVFDAPLGFADVEARTVNPQSGRIAYRVEAGKIDWVGDDSAVLTLTSTGDMPEAVEEATLTLNAGALDLDTRAIPAGFIMMAIGLVGFAGTLFRKRRDNPNSKPPPTRWGRGN